MTREEIIEKLVKYSAPLGPKSPDNWCEVEMLAMGLWRYGEKRADELMLRLREQTPATYVLGIAWIVYYRHGAEGPEPPGPPLPGDDE